jgi:hypothetical protein
VLTGISFIKDYIFYSLYMISIKYAIPSLVQKCGLESQFLHEQVHVLIDFKSMQVVGISL